MQVATSGFLLTPLEQLELRAKQRSLSINEISIISERLSTFIFKERS